MGISNVRLVSCREVNRHLEFWVFARQARAKSKGQEWALKQLDSRIEAYDLPLKTEEEEKKKAAMAGWFEYQREDQGEWVCEIINHGGVVGENSVVRVQRFVVE